MIEVTSGCVYMLLAARLGKFDDITVMGVIIGLFLFISGHFVLSFIASIVFPVAADLIARAGKYKSKALLLVSYVVFDGGRIVHDYEVDEFPPLSPAA